MAADIGKSLAIQGLDSIPYTPQTAGQGAPDRLCVIDDVVAATATGLGTAKSSYRLCRIPTGAQVKAVWLATDVPLDTGTHALVFDINIAFSDSAIDGTPANVQGLIPTTSNNGTVTTLSAYSNPNIIFGTVNNTSTTAGLPLTQVTFNGSRTNYPLTTLTLDPLWQNFGFVNGQGNPQDPNGYFDLFLVNSTVAGTGASGNIYGRVEFSV
jgi:hypothetical protein